MASPSEIIEAETRRYVRGYRSASLCVGLTQGGTHHARVLRDREAPPGTDGVYALGELTQVFTGALLALLVERGELALGTSLAELIPRSLLPDEAAGRITLEQLATHTSGMPHLPPNLGEGKGQSEDPFGHYSAGLFGEFLRGYRPERPPPRPAAESILGMGVLGHALSRRAGVNYAHALRDLLFKPLGMGDTSGRPTEEQEGRVRPGHTARGRRVPTWTFPALPGAGALFSTVPDLLRFLDANLGRGEDGLVRALRLTQAPRVEAGPRRVGLGWNISTVRGQTVVWRSSVMGGFTGFLGFAPAADAGVVLLSDHGWSLLSALRGRVPLEAPGFALLSRLVPAP